MKQKTRAIAGFILLITAMPSARAAFAAAPSLQLQPGKYSLTITSEVQDQRQNESRSATRCVRPADLTNPEEIFNDRADAQKEKQEACMVKNFKSANGRISYEAECPNRSVHVQGTLEPAGFSIVRTVTPKASPKILLKYVVTGKRDGDCSAATDTAFEEDAFTQ